MLEPTAPNTEVSRSSATIIPGAALAVAQVFDRAGEQNRLDQSLHRMGAVISYPRQAEIFVVNDAADYLYRVISGIVQTYRVVSGRRQIGGFYVPGDIFGIEFSPKRTLSAEAVTDTKVQILKRSAINALAGRDAAIARELFILTARQLWRAQERMLLLVKSAQERVAGFLIEMADRMATCDAVELPMSRKDIADYLGLTIETVSRTLTSMQSAAVIEMPTSRCIVLCDRSALKRLNGS